MGCQSGRAKGKKYNNVERTKTIQLITERTDTGYSIYSPELPGCIATGTTWGEARANMDIAVKAHTEQPAIANLKD